MRALTLPLLTLRILSASKLVSWASVGRYNPTVDDFA